MGPTNRQKELKDKVQGLVGVRPSYWNKLNKSYTFKWAVNLTWRQYIRVCRILADEIKSGEVNVGFHLLDREFGHLWPFRSGYGFRLNIKNPKD